jgi:hypothetical protein
MQLFSYLTKKTYFMVGLFRVCNLIFFGYYFVMWKPQTTTLK